MMHFVSKKTSTWKKRRKHWLCCGLIVLNHLKFCYRQVKCEVIKKASQGGSDWRCQTVFVLMYCMSCGRSLSWNGGGGSRPGAPPSSTETYFCWNTATKSANYNTDIVILSPAYCVCAFWFNFWIVVWARCHRTLHALFGFIYEN